MEISAKVKRAVGGRHVHKINFGDRLYVNSDILNNKNIEKLYEDNKGVYLSSMAQVTESDFKRVLSLACYREILNITWHVIKSDEYQPQEIFTIFKAPEQYMSYANLLPAISSYTIHSTRQSQLLNALDKLDELRSTRTKSQTSSVVSTKKGDEEFVTKYIFLPKATPRATTESGGIDDKNIYTWEFEYTGETFNLSVRDMKELFESKLITIYQEQTGHKASSGWTAQQYSFFRGKSGHNSLYGILILGNADKII